MDLFDATLCSFAVPRAVRSYWAVSFMRAEFGQPLMPVWQFRLLPDWRGTWFMVVERIIKKKGKNRERKRKEKEKKGKKREGGGTILVFFKQR
jgi:hypothetical protein